MSLDTLNSIRKGLSGRVRNFSPTKISPFSERFAYTIFVFWLFQTHQYATTQGADAIALMSMATVPYGVKFTPYGQFFISKSHDVTRCFITQKPLVLCPDDMHNFEKAYELSFQTKANLAQSDDEIMYHIMYSRA